MRRTRDDILRNGRQTREIAMVRVEESHFYAPCVPVYSHMYVENDSDFVATK